MCYAKLKSGASSFSKTLGCSKLSARSRKPKGSNFRTGTSLQTDVYKCYCHILLSKVRGSGVLFICVFGLLDSSFYERNKQKREAEVTMTLRNYLPVDKKGLPNLDEATTVLRIVGSSLFQDRCESLRSPGIRVIVSRGE